MYTAIIQQNDISRAAYKDGIDIFINHCSLLIKRWAMKCPTHHYALGIDHHADTIAKIAEVLDIEYIIVR